MIPDQENSAVDSLSHHYTPVSVSVKTNISTFCFAWKFCVATPISVKYKTEDEEKSVLFHTSSWSSSNLLQWTHFGAKSCWCTGTFPCPLPFYCMAKGEGTFHENVQYFHRWCKKSVKDICWSCFPDVHELFSDNQCTPTHRCSHLQCHLDMFYFSFTCLC